MEIIIEKKETPYLDAISKLEEEMIKKYGKENFVIFGQMGIGHQEDGINNLCFKFGVFTKAEAAELIKIVESRSDKINYLDGLCYIQPFTKYLSNEVRLIGSTHQLNKYYLKEHEMKMFYINKKLQYATVLL